MAINYHKYLGIGLIVAAVFFLWTYFVILGNLIFLLIINGNMNNDYTTDDLFGHLVIGLSILSMGIWQLKKSKMMNKFKTLAAANLTIIFGFLLFITFSYGVQTDFFMITQDMTPTWITTESNDVHVKIINDSEMPFCEKNNVCYAPIGVTIKSGNSVIWSNDSLILHTVTAGTFEDGLSRDIFDSDVMKPGNTFSYQFNESGIYPYYCVLHPWMVGVVLVS